MIYRKSGVESVAWLPQQPGFVSSFEMPAASGRHRQSRRTGCRRSIPRNEDIQLTNWIKTAYFHYLGRIEVDEICLRPVIGAGKPPAEANLIEDGTLGRCD